MQQFRVYWKKLHDVERREYVVQVKNKWYSLWKDCWMVHETQPWINFKQVSDKNYIEALKLIKDIKNNDLEIFIEGLFRFKTLDVDSNAGIMEK